MEDNKKNIFGVVFAILVIVIAYVIIKAPFEDKREEDGGSVDANTSTVDERDEELKETLKNLQRDLYPIFKQYVYDEISGGMYYSDVQKLLDSAERQLKNSLSQIDVKLDLSNGTYFPKWIVKVRAGGVTYPLLYIEVECSTSYKIQHKYIGKYEIK